MIGCLLAHLFHADWRAPLTAQPFDDVEEIARRERAALARHIRQEDTVSGAKPRIGDYFDGGQVPR